MILIISGIANNKMSAYNRFEVVRSKFSKKVTLELMKALGNVDWSQRASEVC